MQDFEVGIEYYFREIGQKVPAGSVVTLRPGDAERYMTSHPGLLKPVRQMAVASPKVIRAADPVAKEVVEEKVDPVVEPEVAVEPAEVESEDKSDEPKKRGRAKK